jgi:hypothetical protein
MMNKNNENKSNKKIPSTFNVILWLIFFFPVGLYKMWKHKKWSPKVRKIVTAFFAIMVFLVIISDNSATNQEIQNGSVTSELDVKQEVPAENIEQDNQIEETESTTDENAEGDENTQESDSKSIEEKEVEEDLKTTYPRLSEETMDKNFIFSCEYGDEVVLWNQPASLNPELRARHRVPCGTSGWAFNQYENEGIIYYAVQSTEGTILKPIYGWVNEDILTWFD